MTTIDNFNLSYLQNNSSLTSLPSAAISSTPIFSNSFMGASPKMNFDSFSVGMPQLNQMPNIGQGFMPNIDFGKLLEYSMQQYNKQLELLKSFSLALDKPFTNTTNNAASLNDVDYNKSKASRLAREVRAGAKSSPTGYCARHVSNALENIGISAKRGDAYEMASNLSRNNDFKEVSISKDELSSLPEGCILVYPKGSAGYSAKYGHIEVTLGNGSAASDFVNKNVKYASDMRVFVPA